MSEEIDVEWSMICDAFVDAQAAASEAFAALEAFDANAPDESQEAYDKWRDANNDARDVLEQATVAAARNYVIAHLAEQGYFERIANG